MGETPDNIVPITSDALSAAERFGAEHNRELLTILFTDLVDSTQLQSKLGNVESARLTQLHREIVRDELAKYDAREIEWAGDSCLAVFTKPSDGVLFALRLQAALRDARLVEGNMPPVRIGLHLGEIVVRQNEGAQKEDLFGLQVSEAARVMSLARANQIYCTRAVFDNAQSSLKGRKLEGLQATKWINHGPFELKGSDEPVEVCEVGEEGFSPLLAPEANDKCRPIKGDIQKWRKRREKGQTERRGVSIRTLATSLAAASLVAAIVSGAAVWQLRSQAGPIYRILSPLFPPEPSVVQLPYQFEIDTKIPNRRALWGDAAAEVAISNDGLRMAYVASLNGRRTLYLRSVDQLGPTQVPIDGEAWRPFFSPDGEWIGFYESGVDGVTRLMKVPFRGGSTQMLYEGSHPAGGTWLDDDTIVFAVQDSQHRVDLNPFASRLFRVSSDGSNPQALTKSGPVGVHIHPHSLPGGTAILFNIAESIEQRNVAVLNLETGKIKRNLIENADSAQYTDSGHIVFVRKNLLRAVPFDLDTLSIVGPEVPIPEEFVSALSPGEKPYAISRNGSFAYVPKAPIPERMRQLVWVDHIGREETLALPPGKYHRPRVSPDGSRIVMAIEHPDNQDLWIHELSQPDSLLPLRVAPGLDGDPVWFPSGEHVVFESHGAPDFVSKVYTKRADLSGEATLLYEHDALMGPYQVSPTDHRLLFATNPNGYWEVGSLAVNSDGTKAVDDSGNDASPEKLIQWPSHTGDPLISPDGNWIVHDAVDEDGTEHIYVRPYPDVNDEEWKVSIEGGSNPVWSANSDEIYYRNGDKMMAVVMQTEPRFILDRPERLFEQPYFATGEGSRQYDVEYPEMNRFLMMKEIRDTITIKIVYVGNFREELTRLAPKSSE